jgi:hypothetical protein
MRQVSIAFLSVLLFCSAVALFIPAAQANPIIRVYNDIAPPEGTEPPAITIQTPQNGSVTPKNTTLTFHVAVPQTNGDQSLDGITKITYQASWNPREVTVAEDVLGDFSLDLSDAPAGNLSVTVYAFGIGYIETGEDYRQENGVLYSYHHYDRFEMVGSSTVHFTKDVMAPKITVTSPTNRTYTNPDVELDFTVNEATSEIQYSLDGAENQTTTNSVTLKGLPNGEHNLTFYATDLAGNAASPQTINFTIEAQNALLLPLVVLIVSVVLVSLGFMVYFKKRR